MDRPAAARVISLLDMSCAALPPGYHGAAVQIATFDFHNTVAHCDDWFELEIRELPAAILGQLGRDGTVPSDTETLQRATSTYRELRHEIMGTGIEKDAQASVEHVFATMGIDVAPVEIASVIERLMRESKRSLTPVPGAVEAISTLIAAGVPVGIISSAVYHPFLEWALDDFGVLDDLAFVATSASIGYYKSDTRIYHHAYGLVDASTELGVHIGDSPRWDVQVAREAGLGTVLYIDETRELTPTAKADVAPDILLTSLVGAHEPILQLLEERRRARPLV
jgi:FMN phosphatase YigB (HAD superfamily)